MCRCGRTIDYFDCPGCPQPKPAVDPIELILSKLDDIISLLKYNHGKDKGTQEGSQEGSPQGKEGSPYS